MSTARFPCPFCDRCWSQQSAVEAHEPYCAKRSEPLVTNPGGEPIPDRRYGYFDGPWPMYPGRITWRPFEERIAEFAERTGRPVLPATRATASSIARANANGHGGAR